MNFNIVEIALIQSITRTVYTYSQTHPKMFKTIDDDGNGNIDKDEMKKLVEEACVANMSERDYNVLFASIDLDENGTLDFVEFCAFFASINVEEGNDETFEDA